MSHDTTWWLYILETVHGQLYTGVTTDVDRRLKEHTKGAPKGARALRGKAPLMLRYHCAIGSRSEALRAEYVIKRLSRARKLDLIAGSVALNEFIAVG